MKSIRIIVEAVTAAIQSGLALRDTRRAQRGAADLKGSQVAAPVVISAESIDLSKVEIPSAIAAASVLGKPPAVVQKIVDGKLENYYSTVCLLDQPFVKQNDKSIKDLVASQIAHIGENIQIRRFTRYQLGA